MKRIGCLLLFAACIAGTAVAQNNAKRTPVFVIYGPTIIAFYPHFSQKDLDTGEGDAEAMDDFSYYADQVEGRLKKAGIEFLSEEAKSFKVRDGARVLSFSGGKISIGYYFIAPGKEPRVEYGVMTDEDILGVAAQYFGKSI
ncbi:MAG: hypothetical protein WBP85_05175 [Terracidiphilus sp.]